jgi:glycosyltransferase involved in cell wall biosynthesis
VIEQYAVNGRFVTQPVTGVQRYCYELSKRLRYATVIAPRAAREEYHDLEPRLFITGGYLTGHAWEQLTLMHAAPKRRALLSPAGCGPIGHPSHFVIIHDVACLENPQWYSRAFAIWYSQLLPALARRSLKILTVSEFCKRRIIELLHVAENNVVVTGEAASACFSPRPEEEVKRALRRFGLSEPYFLAVGAVSRRKNLSRLLEAWRRAAGELNGASLALVGKEGMFFAGGSVLGSLPEHVIHLQSVNDQDLACLYTGSRGLLYPSLYEGFGLPLIEAMACGCPVLTSNCTSMPEVAGDAAILVNPLDEESIADGIRLLACGRQLQDLRSRGFERHRRYSWECTAQVVENAILT